MQTLAGTAGTAGTAEKGKGGGDSSETLPSDTAPPIRATRWLLHYADREPMEVHFAPAADHDEALAVHPGAVAAEPLPEMPAQSAHEPARQSAARGCSMCRHRRRPGLSAGYCGGGRDDLPGAYGLHHPLRKLPDDQGESCASYLPHEG
ncbi:MAG: hypothetical protein KF731_07610 [Thauera sp.]|nr:hypothetical protein [Thauera sp.]